MEAKGISACIRNNIFLQNDVYTSHPWESDRRLIQDCVEDLFSKVSTFECMQLTVVTVLSTDTDRAFKVDDSLGCYT